MATAHFAGVNGKTWCGIPRDGTSARNNIDDRIDCRPCIQNLINYREISFATGENFVSLSWLQAIDPLRARLKELS